MSLRKLYGFIVGKCGIEPNYFFDEMSFAEIECLFESYEETFQNEWEKVRTINHAVISSQSTKPVKPEDVLKFAWDNKDESSGKKGLSDKDRERLMNKVKNKK